MVCEFFRCKYEGAGLCVSMSGGFAPECELGGCWLFKSCDFCAALESCHELKVDALNCGEEPQGSGAAYSRPT